VLVILEARVVTSPAEALGGKAAFTTSPATIIPGRTSLRSR
jgi:hypothetical protein